MKDREFLAWIHARLENVYSEWLPSWAMYNLRAIIEKTPPERHTIALGSGSNSLDQLNLDVYPDGLTDDERKEAKTPVVASPKEPALAPSVDLRDFFAAGATEDDIRDNRASGLGNYPLTRTQARYAFADLMLAARDETPLRVPVSTPLPGEVEIRIGTDIGMRTIAAVNEALAQRGLVWVTDDDSTEYGVTYRLASVATEPPKATDEVIAAMSRRIDEGLQGQSDAVQTPESPKPDLPGCKPCPYCNTKPWVRIDDDNIHTIWCPNGGCPKVAACKRHLPRLAAGAGMAEAEAKWNDEVEAIP